MGVVRPTGSLPARVYWVRRGVVLVLLAAVVLLLVLGLRALTGGGDANADTPDPDPAPTQQTPAPEESEDAGTPACDPAALTVELAADAATYPEGAQPLFTVRLTNTGEAACLVDAGDAQRQLLITSGSDRIWASTDCAAGEPLQLLLGPGQADERQVQWDRVRSVEGCAAGQSSALSGTYQAVLTLAGVSTEPVVFGLD
ncbi:hypothetical protein [Cellulomonas endometrii]|jgi:hypothetical protein|uniref:hypothetical protein n=1 Tax=Cellulomonas endometrii TaxID=3036301 RepID=UPI0024AC883D|nr:hypothetical protein [Cellulomonas endometrii]